MVDGSDLPADRVAGDRAGEGSLRGGMDRGPAQCGGNLLSASNEHQRERVFLPLLVLDFICIHIISNFFNFCHY